MKHSQRPYTVHDPFHSSSYYTLKRKAFCVGCIHNDEFLSHGTEMAAGTKTVKVVSGSGPFSRSQHFHPECYAYHVNHVMTAITASSWKVYPARDLSDMSKLPHDGSACMDSTIKSACKNIEGDDFDFAADYIPF